MRVCHPSPPARRVAIRSLSRRRVISVLLSPRGRPRRRTASTIWGTASRGARAVFSSAALNGASSARLRRLGADFFIWHLLSAVRRPETDHADTFRPIGEDQRAHASVQDLDGRSPHLAVSTTRPIHEFPHFLEGDAVLGKVARGLGRIPNEQHYLLLRKIGLARACDDSRPIASACAGGSA